MGKPAAKSLNQLQRSLPIALLRTREAVMEQFRPMLRAHDVTEQQWRVLRALDQHGELIAADLAEAACVLAPSLSRILQKLDHKGLVSVRRDSEDGRRSLASLTPHGRRFLNRLAPHSAEIYQAIEARLGRNDIESLLDVLERVQDSLSSAKTPSKGPPA